MKEINRMLELAGVKQLNEARRGGLLTAEEFADWYDDEGGKQENHSKIDQIHAILKDNGADEDDDIEEAYDDLSPDDQEKVSGIIRLRTTNESVNAGALAVKFANLKSEKAEEIILSVIPNGVSIDKDEEGDVEYFTELFTPKADGFTEADVEKIAKAYDEMSGPNLQNYANDLRKALDVCEDLQEIIEGISAPSDDVNESLEGLNVKVADLLDDIMTEVQWAEGE